MPEHPTALLIPGLFSPRWHMSGLRRSLQRYGIRATIWDDASVFGDLETSVERLRRRLDDHDQDLGIVTHSFGDWLFRQAVARSGAMTVRSLVSLVPVMRQSPAARLAGPLADILPAIAVMASDERAASALNTPPEIDRLVVWARVDPWIRRATSLETEATRSVTVSGTHNTVLWQSGVHRLTAAHLRPALEQ